MIKQYKAVVDTTVQNRTLGLVLNPGDIVEVDYKEKTIINKTTSEVSRLRRTNMEALFSGKMSKKTKNVENSLQDRLEMGNDGNLIPIKKSTKKAGG